MKTITEYENIIARLQSEGKPHWAVKEEEANCTMFMAYFTSKMEGKELLDFDIIIWEKDIEHIADALRKFNISEFTISVHASAIIDTIMAFQDMGIRLEGMTKVHTTKPDIYMNEKGRWVKGNKILSAFLMKVE